MGFYFFFLGLNIQKVITSVRLPAFEPRQQVKAVTGTDLGLGNQGSRVRPSSQNTEGCAMNTLKERECSAKSERKASQGGGFRLNGRYRKTLIKGYLEALGGAE